MQIKLANEELMETEEDEEPKIAKKNKGLYILKQFGKIGKHNKYKSIFLFLLFSDKGINHLF